MHTGAPPRPGLPTLALVAASPAHSTPPYPYPVPVPDLYISSGRTVALLENAQLQSALQHFCNSDVPAEFMFCECKLRTGAIRPQLGLILGKRAENWKVSIILLHVTCK